MGISRDMEYSCEDLLEQPKLVAEYIRKLDAKNVLELGVGKGASSIYLAEKFPDIHFDGIDLPNGQLDIAKRGAKKVENFRPVEGDYHNLGRFSTNHFDVVFAIEALCHSTVKEKVLGEVRRVLREGGVFIVFDGYLGKPRSSLKAAESLAVQLTEKGMVVKEFENYAGFKDKVSKAKFETIYEEDVSQFILPTVERFERLAEKALFNRPKIGRIIVRFFPSEFAANAIAGYLMPELVKLGIARYVILVARKADLAVSSGGNAQLVG